jgi:hypothetical protein
VCLNLRLMVSVCGNNVEGRGMQAAQTACLAQGVWWWTSGTISASHREPLSGGASGAARQSHEQQRMGHRKLDNDECVGKRKGEMISVWEWGRERMMSEQWERMECCAGFAWCLASAYGQRKEENGECMGKTKAERSIGQWERMMFWDVCAALQSKTFEVDIVLHLLCDRAPLHDKIDCTVLPFHCNSSLTKSLKPWPILLECFDQECLNEKTFRVAHVPTYPWLNLKHVGWISLDSDDFLLRARYWRSGLFDIIPRLESLSPWCINGAPFGWHRSPRRTQIWEVINVSSLTPE